MADRLPAVTESAGTAGRIARTALKAVVKDAVREVHEERAASSGAGESGASSRGPPAGIGLLLIGILVGYLLARRSAKPGEAVAAIRERSPVGGETREESGDGGPTGQGDEPAGTGDTGSAEDVTPEEGPAAGN